MSNANAVAINFTGWINNGSSVSAPVGYNAHDYFTAEIPAEFASEANAQAFIAANYKGVDSEGTAPAFEIY